MTELLALIALFAGSCSLAASLIAYGIGYQRGYAKARTLPIGYIADAYSDATGLHLNAKLDRDVKTTRG